MEKQKKKTKRKAEEGSENSNSNGTICPTLKTAMPKIYITPCN